MFKFTVFSSFIFFFAVITSAVYRRGDRSHWCCDVEVQTTYTNVTHIKYDKVNVTVIREVLTNITRPCHDNEKPDAHIHGFFSHLVPMCRVTKQVKLTVEKLVPQNVTDSIPQEGVCPPEHTVCCDGFQLLNDQCVESRTANSPELQKLIDAGLVVG